MNKLVSVVISVYNKEPFLKKCIESLINLNMEHSKLEAIFVDDCSTDQSVAMIESYASQYDFIKLIQLQTNTGSPSEPRNIGIKEAKGKYIALLDADDWLDTEGFPRFMEKVNADDAELGLGQTFKHTNKSITYHARFTAYKDASKLMPQDIEKIFRAVGPPGKVFKRDIVINNQIQFEHMKFGEDKLFFIDLISKIQNITMSTIPAYHVNRYDENQSLVKETSVVDKAYLNVNITKRICNMDISESLKKMMLSRMVEVDFFRRLLHTKTFLKSDDKQTFYAIFDEVEHILNEYGYHMNEFINNKKFIAMYTLYHQEDKEPFLNLTEALVYGYWHYYIKKDAIYMEIDGNYDVLEPTPVRCYPVYEGTQMLNGELYEVIKVLKPENVQINGVKLVEINNSANAYHVDYVYKDKNIYIHQQQFKQAKEIDVNLSVEFGEMNDIALVYASYPSNNEIYKMKRQSFKLEFVNKLREKYKGKYFLTASEPLMTLKKTNVYRDIEFKEQLVSLNPGTKVVPTDVQFTSNGTPRLILEDGSVITANKDFVTQINMDDHHKYITEVPSEVKIKKVCKLYNSRTFKNEPLETLKVGDTINIANIAYTNKSTPRLVTQEGNYLTANKDFIEVISM
ncbi:glycosyltransferase family 2 protein [Staphylococcus cohnii]|uniref:glycosyltransferase family 2 protein n=1 Tax=Staphylococcus cohnii species complex TaxID=3239053 RepID=UPI001CCBEF6B|nr:glycosyltransferase family 2 protein [Staphylococcus cohnii]MBZ8173179.1 glycosyltransferase family 2 protein [Staphylococcus cohnii]